MPTDGSDYWLVIQLGALTDLNFCTGTKSIPREWVSSLLDSLCLPYAPRDLDTLWRALNILRVTVPASEAVTGGEFSDRIIKCLDGLLEDLPLAIHSQPKPQVALALDGLLAAVRSANRVIDRGHPGRRGGQPWHDDAMWLCYLLRTAAYLLECPEKVILKSAGGNGVLFIKKALHKAYGMHLEGDAIVKAIRRYADGKIPGVNVTP